MWTTVLVLAVALNAEPNRLAVIALLLLRPRPIRQLLVFLGVSFLVSFSAGLLVLFVLRRGVPANVNGGYIQLGVGVVALVAAAVLAVRRPSRGSGLVDTLTARVQRLVSGQSLWFPALVGVGIALPSVDYLALLLIIATAGVPPGTQVAALLTFLVVANIVLLVPVVGRIVAPDRTRAALERLRAWVLARRSRDYAVLLAVVGVLMVVVGARRL